MFKIHADGRRLGRIVRPVAARDPRAFKLTRYLNPLVLTAPPPSMDHASLVPSWPMYLNDQLGDCGPAGAAHQDMSWAAYAGRSLSISDTQVKTFYFGITGGQDSGVMLEDMFAYWRKTGLAGDKLEAYVETDAGDLTQFKLAIQLFGSVGLGLSLPDKNTFGPWDSPNPLKDYGPPDPNNGHYVCGVAYDDAKQQATVISWGDTYTVSYAFIKAYNDQTMVGLNDLEISPTSGQSPEAFDFATLQDDLNHLKDPVTPPDQPPPPAPGGGGCLGGIIGGVAMAAMLLHSAHGTSYAAAVKSAVHVAELAAQAVAQSPILNP